MATSETVGFGGKEPPPPSWDGTDPAVQLLLYEKNVKLWMYESELEMKKRGVRLLRNLTGVARSVADNLEFEEIACEKGVENLLSTLKAHFAPHLELSLPRAFERAVYVHRGGSKETIQEYLIRVERAFYLLTKEGLQLDETARGYVGISSGVTHWGARSEFTTWSKGQFDWKTVVASLRRLDTVIPSSSRLVFSCKMFLRMMNQRTSLSPRPSPRIPRILDDEEMYILVEEATLTRFTRKARRRWRWRHIKRWERPSPCNRRTGNTLVAAKDGVRRGNQRKACWEVRWASQDSHRRAQAENKVWKVRAHRPWARECTNPPDRVGLQRGSNSTSMASSKAGSSSQSQQSWYVAMGESSGSLQCVSSCFGFSCRGMTRKEDLVLLIAVLQMIRRLMWTWS